MVSRASPLVSLSILYIEDEVELRIRLWLRQARDEEVADTIAGICRLMPFSPRVLEKKDVT